MTRRSLRQDKIAKVYDKEILPLWARRFGRLLLAHIHLPERAMVLEVGCRTGYFSLELIRRLDGQSRIIALDHSSALLDVARSKAGDLSGRRIFFRSERLTGKLAFADDVYDLTCSNVGLDEVEAPLAEAVAEMARVTKPGGQVAVSLPLEGTWGEFFDLYREVLVKADRDDILQRLEEHLEEYPSPAEVRRVFEQAGLQDVSVEMERFQLLFKSAREFFFAPVVEYGPLRTWKALAGKGQEMQDIFWNIKEAIDAYFGGVAFSVSVVAGCVTGWKQALPEEPDEVLDVGELSGLHVLEEDEDLEERTTAPRGQDGAGSRSSELDEDDEDLPTMPSGTSPETS